MLSLFTQTAIAVLHDISSGNDLQSVNFLLSVREWEYLFGKLEEGGLIRCLPHSESRTLASYELCRPLPEITLLDVLEATDEPIRCTMPTPEEFYIRHSRIANKVGVLNQVARMFLSRLKYPTGNQANHHPL